MLFLNVLPTEEEKKPSFNISRDWPQKPPTLKLVYFSSHFICSARNVTPTFPSLCFPKGLPSQAQPPHPQLLCSSSASPYFTLIEDKFGEKFSETLGTRSWIELDVEVKERAGSMIVEKAFE